MHHVYSPKFYITTFAGYDVVSREIADKIGGDVGGGGLCWGGEVSQAYLVSVKMVRAYIHLSRFNFNFLACDN